MDLGHGDLMELVEAEIFRLFLSRGDRSEEILRSHQHFRVALLINQLVGCEVSENLISGDMKLNPDISEEFIN